MAETHTASPQHLTASSKDFFLAEYGALREEILKRIEILHQLKTGALLVWATVLGFAVQSSNKESATDLVLMYPLVALAISYLWSFNNRAIILTGNYIRIMEDEAQAMGGGLGWEQHVRGKSSGVNSAIGIFVATQLVTLFAVKYIASLDVVSWLIDWRVLTGLVVTLLTGFIIRRSEQHVPFPQRRSYIAPEMQGDNLSDGAVSKSATSSSPTSRTPDPVA